MRPDDLYSSPNALAPDYSHFRVSERLLLTGHSHQAWPDCGFAAQQQAWLDAAEFVDSKWERVAEQAGKVRQGYGRLLGEPDGDIAIDQNTQDLVVRFVSALPLQTRPRLVTTDGEFHTLRRLLDRLAEDGYVEVVRVAAFPVETLTERLALQVNERTSAAFCSSVLFQSGRIVPNLPHLAAVCAQFGAELLIDAYHHLNVVPFSLEGLEQAYVTGGGYKYCQLGEGVGFLRLPRDCQLRPITTGWFTEYGDLAAPTKGQVEYGRGGLRFAGATYDPTSVYRAAAVFAFFAERGLTPEFLRTVSQHQIRLLAERFDALDLNPTLLCRDRAIDIAQIGGFLALQSAHAGEISQRLRQAGVWTDSRGHALRFGPAPYLSDAQLVEAVEWLGKVCKTFAI